MNIFNRGKWGVQKALNYRKERALNGKLVLVYSMGKVGSTSIVRTLKNHFPYSRLYSAHFLSDSWMKRLEEIQNFINHKHGLELRTVLKKHSNKRLKILTLVREPLAREISNFFENPEDFIGQRSPLELPTEELLSFFYQKINVCLDYTLNWFNTEFEEFMGINIYDHELNKEAGYTLLTFSDCDVAVLQMEQLNQNISAAFKELLNIDIAELDKANQAAQKPYKDVYKQFKLECKFSKEVINKVYDSAFVKHFYSESQIEGYRSYWLSKLRLING